MSVDLEPRGSAYQASWPMWPAGAAPMTQADGFYRLNAEAGVGWDTVWFESLSEHALVACEFVRSPFLTLLAHLADESFADGHYLDALILLQYHAVLSPGD